MKSSIQQYSPLIRKCYLDDVPGELDQLRRAWLETAGKPHFNHGWLALAAIFWQCSPGRYSQLTVFPAVEDQGQGRRIHSRG